MKKQARTIIGILILALSVVLLVLGFMPFDRITRIQPISPSDLQLPTPTSLRIQPITMS